MGGLDPLAYLTVRDPVEQVVLDAVVVRAGEEWKHRADYQAAQIARVIHGDG